MPRKNRAYSYFIHTFPNTYMITKTAFLYHLFYGVQINSTHILPTTMLRIYQAYSYFILNFTNKYTITKPCLLRHLLYDVHTNNALTPPCRLQDTARYLFPNTNLTYTYYKTYPPYTHYTQHT